MFFFLLKNQVQVQPIPGTQPVATGTLPTATQTQMAVVPQAQPSVLMPTQQHVPNNQVLYAAPGTIPVQGVVPQVVAQNPLQYQPGMVATTPGLPVAGQVDVNTASSYGVPAVQPVVSVTYRWPSLEFSTDIIIPMSLIVALV